MNKLTFTVENLMAKTGQDRMACYGLLRFLESVGVANRFSAPRAEGQKGRNTHVYSLNETFAIDLARLLQQDQIVSLQPASVEDDVTPFGSFAPNEVDTAPVLG